MKKDAYYFSHDSNARHDPKLGAVRAKCGWAGYGLYWAIIEVLRDQPDYSYPNGLLYGLELACGFGHYDNTKIGCKFDEFIKFLISVDLLKLKDEKLYSSSLIERMNALNETRARLSEAGKRGAETRWGGHKPANATPIAVKESKGKESIKNKVVLTDSQFIETLKTNPAYKGIDIETELGRMDAWLLTHPGRQKTRRFIVGWLNRKEKVFDGQPGRPSVPFPSD